MSRIDSWHWKISTGRHFQNGHHNTTKIQHCPISSKFHMWVHWAFWKWRPVEIVQCRESIWDIIIYPHIKLWWYRTMLILISTPFHMWVHYVVSNWFLTLNNFYRSPFSKWPPQYRKKSTLSDIITIWYVSNCDDIGQCWFFAVLLWPFWKWRPVEIVQSRESRSPFSKWPPQYRKNSTLSDIITIWYVGR
jgi:hypothetical protein